MIRPGSALNTAVSSRSSRVRRYDDRSEWSRPARCPKASRVATDENQGVVPQVQVVPVRIARARDNYVQ